MNRYIGRHRLAPLAMHEMLLDFRRSGDWSINDIRAFIGLELFPEPVDDWTACDGRSNSSPEFLKLAYEVERLIVSDARRLIGNANPTALLIVAQLAHRHGMAPRQEADRP